MQSKPGTGGWVTGLEQSTCVRKEEGGLGGKGNWSLGSLLGTRERRDAVSYLC